MWYSHILSIPGSDSVMGSEVVSNVRCGDTKQLGVTKV